MAPHCSSSLFHVFVSIRGIKFHVCRLICPPLYSPICPPYMLPLLVSLMPESNELGTNKFPNDFWKYSKGWASFLIQKNCSCWCLSRREESSFMFLGLYASLYAPLLVSLMSESNLFIYLFIYYKSSCDTHKSELCSHFKNIVEQSCIKKY